MTPLPVSTTLVSLDTACAITDISKSTWWRRIAKGDVTKLADGARARALLAWADIQPHVSVVLSADDVQLILQADAGSAQAQAEAGQLFCLLGKHRAAVYWFNLAALKGDTDAMQWLGVCHAYGHGVAQDDNLAVMWLAKAASQGHVIAKAQIDGLLNRARNPQAAPLGLVKE